MIRTVIAFAVGVIVSTITDSAKRIKNYFEKQNQKGATK